MPVQGNTEAVAQARRQLKGLMKALAGLGEAGGGFGGNTVQSVEWSRCLCFMGQRTPLSRRALLATCSEDEVWEFTLLSSQSNSA